MITELRLQNFRCFEDHTIPFKRRTVIIGRNNAGKTTLVEALRLVSLLTERHDSLNYKEPPRWGGIPRREYGASLYLRNIEFNFDNIFHRYGNPPAVITAKFENKSSVKVYLGHEGENHCVVFAPDGNIVRSKSVKGRATLPVVQIMPQVGPVSKNETLLTEDYVKKASSSALAHLHFRNQLDVFSGSFRTFKQMVEATWPGLQIHKFIIPRLENESFQLLIRDDNFVAEVGNMGHGLQMWLQTIWFLARSSNANSVILDEPDVYMHPDLQRRLVRFIRQKFDQVIITTHSVEIMSEVDPEDILVIEKEKSASRFAVSLPSVQRIIDSVGSVHNIQLARFWNSRCFVLVEGKDIKILSIIFDKLFPSNQDGLLSFPYASIGGWNGWNYAVASAKFLRNAGGDSIEVFCILDSDYHPGEEITKRYAEARNEKISLHIWQRKEIENYFIIPSVFVKIIELQNRKPANLPSLEDIEKKMEDIFDSLKDDVLDGMSDSIRSIDRKLTGGGANKKARELLKPQWSSPQGRINRCSGKEFFSRLSGWSQEKFGVNLSASIVARYASIEDIPHEMAQVLTAIRENRSLIQNLTPHRKHKT